MMNLPMSLGSRLVLRAIGVLCMVLVVVGLYLQQTQGLEPCPMCIVQRYTFILIAFFSLLASSIHKKEYQKFGLALVAFLAVFGAVVAARQSYLQWFPPEFASCGRDLYGMIESFPLSRVIPLVFKGGGDCSAVDWTFLGGSIANWSFLAFTSMAVISVLTFASPGHANTPSNEG